MQFDIDKMAAMDRYVLLLSTIVPRPIALVTSISSEGAIELKLIGGMHDARWYAKLSGRFAMDRPSWAEWLREAKAK
jgi:hypothetical protein